MPSYIWIFLGSNITTAPILPRPKYKNAKLEQKINENKDKTELWLHSLNLNDNDMELVAYYLFQTNVVSNFMLQGIRFIILYIDTYDTLPS